MTGEAWNKMTAGDLLPKLKGRIEKMKFGKKLVCLFLAALMLLSLAACGDEQQGSVPQEQITQATEAPGAVGETDSEETLPKPRPMTVSSSSLWTAIIIATLPTITKPVREV